MSKGLIMIPVDTTKPVRHADETAASLGLKLGHSASYMQKVMEKGYPVMIEGEWYYVDYEL